MTLPSPEALAALRARYAEPHRVVHTWTRVTEMLAQAEDVVNGIADRGAFILAILFHRAVYDPRRPDATARSIALMREMMHAAATPARLARAEALILATVRQELPETDDASLRGDAALLLDFSHAILGAEPDRFEAHEAGLRQEHAHLNDDLYAAGRSAALQLLLWRERIFVTDRFFLARERRARRNIARAIERLQRG